jgi:hypothetical protein
MIYHMWFEQKQIYLYYKAMFLVSKVLVCRHLLAGTVGSNPTWRAWMSVSCECCMLAGRSLFDELVTRLGESY